MSIGDVIEWERTTIPKHGKGTIIALCDCHKGKPCGVVEVERESGGKTSVNLAYVIKINGLPAVVERLQARHTK